MSTTPSRVPYDSVKRGLDVIAGSLLFLLTLPIQLVVAMAVAITLGRPVLFTQPRPGRDGRIFTLVKFRSMRSGDGPDAERLGRFGAALRSTSLDELPTLLNVIRGDMSMVGPRPLLVRYLPLYTPEQARRHEVRPGITGLAQASGRNALTWDQKFELDVQYVDTRSLLGDARILAMTVGLVFRRTGIASTGEATAQEFTGTSRASEDQP